jgi:lysophospholipase L1-like esterase
MGLSWITTLAAGEDFEASSYLNMTETPNLIVAFGDSISAGEGDSVPAGLGTLHPYSGFTDGTWTDSPDAYPSQLASQLGWDVDNFSISGACASTNPCTTSSNPTVGQELTTAANLDLSPQLVTLTVGADDINFKSCTSALLGVMGVNSKKPLCSGKSFDSELRRFTRNVESDLAQIESMYPSAQIALSLYYNPLPPGLSQNSSSVCSTENAPVLAAALEYAHGDRNPLDYLPLLVRNPLTTAAILKAENKLFAKTYTQGGTTIAALNEALQTAASDEGVTTVQLDVTGHDFCEDYPGGNGGWVFGPHVYAFGSYIKGLISASFQRQYEPSDICAAFDAGCSSKTWTGTFKKFGGTVSYDLILGINDIPHLTPAGQTAAAQAFVDTLGL